MKPIKTTQITDLWSYFETVDWTDPWFAGLLAFHALIFFITFATRNHHMLQAGHFIVLLLLVYFAVTFNELAAKHWQKFSRQQYFDSNGMFISLVWSAPLLMNCLIILMMWILTSSQLMVTTGRLKIEQERRKRAREANEQKNK